MWVLIAAISVLLVAFILSLASMRRKTPLMWKCADRTTSAPVTSLTRRTIPTPIPASATAAAATSTTSSRAILPRYYFPSVTCPSYSSRSRRRSRQRGAVGGAVGGRDPQLRLASILHSSLVALPKYRRGLVALRKRQFDAAPAPRGITLTAL